MHNTTNTTITATTTTTIPAANSIATTTNAKGIKIETSGSNRRPMFQQWVRRMSILYLGEI